MNKPTRFYSDRQEQKVAKVVNGTKTANSGATPFSKGDVVSDLFLIECKTKVKDSVSITVRKEWMVKNREEAFAMARPFNAVCINFGSGENYYIVDEKLFKKLIRYLEEDYG